VRQKITLDYKRKLKGSCQIVKTDDETIPDWEVKMIKNNRITGLLTMEYYGDGEIVYEITGLQSMKNRMEIRRFGEKELKKLLMGLEKLLKTMEDYLLIEENLWLQAEQIYFGKDEVYFTYVPGLSGEEVKKSLSLLLSELVEMADYSDAEYTSLLFAIHEGLKKENVSLKDLLRDCLWEGDAQAGNEKEDSWEAFERAEYERVLGKEEETEEDEVKRPSLADQIRRTLFGVERKAKNYSDLKVIPRGQVREASEEFIIDPEKVSLNYEATEFIDEMEKEENKPFAHLLLPEEMGNYILNGETTVLGKKEEDCDLFFKGRGVSKIHAMIKREEDGYYLKDLNSRNGTYLNGQIIEYEELVRLKSKDRIRMGETELVFEI